MNTRELTDKYNDWKNIATDKARIATQATDRYVRENTWTTIAIAAAAGLILGYVLAGGRSDDEED